MIRVLISRGCPATLSGYNGVANSGPGLDDSLVPVDPVSGLICRFGPLYTPSGLAVPSARLYREAVLNAATASAFAAVIDEVSTAPPQGVFHCPADSGSHSIIVFGYAGRPDVDLWYSDSGCRTLDNGVIGAFEGGNPSFIQTFEGHIEELCPQSIMSAP